MGQPEKNKAGDPARFDDQDNRPEQDADTGRCGGDVLDDLDLVAFLGGDEIADGLDGAVEKLSLQHHHRDRKDHQKIDPLPEKGEKQQHANRGDQLVCDAEVVADSKGKARQNDSDLADRMIAVFTGAEKFVSHGLFVLLIRKNPLWARQINTQNSV